MKSPPRPKAKLASRSGINASEAAGCSGTALKCGGRQIAASFCGEQRPLMLYFEAAVCVSRSAWGSPVADAFLIIRSVELRRVFVGGCAARQHGNGTQN